MNLKRVIIFAVVTIVVVAGAVVGGRALYRQLRYGTVADQTQLTLTVDSGDRFTLSVRDRGASIGDRWTQSADPSDAVVFVDDESPGNPRGLAGCCSGQHLFLFDAAKPGQVRVTLTNCYRGCSQPKDQELSGSVTWIVTIR